MTAAPPSAPQRGVRARRRYAIANVTFPIFLWLVLIGTAPLQEWAFQGAVGAGDVINQVLHVAIFLVLLSAGGMPSRRELFCVPASITLLLAYCFVTVLWAVAPFISFRRATLTAIVVWVTFRQVNDLGPERTFKLLRLALAGLLVVNFMMVFLTPYGIHGEVLGEESSVVGDWRGIIPHKNVTGVVCALTILLYAFDNRQFSRLFSALVIAGAAIFLFYTNSRTSEVILLLGVIAGVVVRPYDPSHRTVIGVFLLFVLGFALQVFSANIDAVTELLNDPGALTGRAAIWPLLLEYAGDHPWTGAGFSSFWQIGDNSPIWTLTAGWVAVYAAHGHNGFLDLLVTIGVPGLLLAVAVLIVWPLLRLLLSLSIEKPRRSLLLALIIFCVGHNLTESSLLNAASVVQVFLLITIAVTYRESDASAGAHQQLRRRMTGLLRGMSRRPLR